MAKKIGRDTGAQNKPQQYEIKLLQNEKSKELMAESNDGTKIAYIELQLEAYRHNKLKTKDRLLYVLKREMVTKNFSVESLLGQAKIKTAKLPPNTPLVNHYFMLVITNFKVVGTSIM